MFSLKNKKLQAILLASVLALSPMLIAGCGDKDQQQGGAAQVKAMKVIQQDTPLAMEYAGQIVGKNTVNVQSKVSGNVVEKYVQGGQFVTAGQPLYRIDSRQYESAVLQARATLAQSQATLGNAQTDLYRDQMLLQANAISEQQVTTQAANVRAYQAATEANQALLTKAQQDLADTTIYAPMSGQLSVNDVAVGTFSAAGNTTLVTIGSSDPVYAQFSISETEYLKFMALHQMRQEAGAEPNANVKVTLTLSDGSEYPGEGIITETDRALADQTGSLTLKALFQNPDGLLLPGMFARVRLAGEVVPNAILVPQRAVQQLLGKSFVMVVGDDGKSVAKNVELGTKVGSYYIINSGISPTDTIVVEGLTNLQEGRELNVTMVTPEEMGFSLTDDTTSFNDSKINASEDAAM